MKPDTPPSRKDERFIRFGMLATCGLLPLMALFDPGTPLLVRLVAGSALVVPPLVWMAIDFAKARTARPR